MTEASESVEQMLSRQVVYDGEDYDRKGLEAMVEEYQGRHRSTIASLDELERTHQGLQVEMTRDLAEQKTAWEHVQKILALQNIGSNLKGVLEKIPVLRDVVPDRPLSVLLTEKLEVAKRRTQEVGNHLDRIVVDLDDLRSDIQRLNRRMVLAARNEEAAASYVISLKHALERLENDVNAAAEGSAHQRELQATRDKLKHRIWEHGAKLRLFSTAENRISDIIRMNNNFLEILQNLHTNMHALYEAGQEVLSEIEGSLAGLASAAQAAEITQDMHGAMTSLKVSANKVAQLASETSLYLTQNVDRMTREMRIYDEGVQQMVETNLRAEREIKEQRIDETIELAEKELASFEEARRN